MTGRSKDQKASSRARERERFQRRKAGQKEHIQQLESALSGYNRLQTQVTIQLQNTARAVAQENRCLHAYLEKLGVDPVEISSQLRMGDITQNTSKATAVSGLQHQPTETPAHLHHHKSPSEPHGKQTTTDSNASPTIDETYKGNVEDDGTSDTPRHPEDLAPAPEQTDQSTTDCTIAAEILTNMSCALDSGFAEAELGCAPASGCRIGNNQLLNVIERVMDK